MAKTSNLDVFHVSSCEMTFTELTTPFIGTQTDRRRAFQKGIVCSEKGLLPGLTLDDLCPQCNCPVKYHTQNDSKSTRANSYHNLDRRAVLFVFPHVHEHDIAKQFHFDLPINSPVMTPAKLWLICDDSPSPQLNGFDLVQLSKDLVGLNS
jgi:hypothetical protein